MTDWEMVSIAKPMQKMWTSGLIKSYEAVLWKPSPARNCTPTNFPSTGMLRGGCPPSPFRFPRRSAPACSSQPLPSQVSVHPRRGGNNASHHCHYRNHHPAQSFVTKVCAQSMILVVDHLCWFLMSHNEQSASPNSLVDSPSWVQNWRFPTT